MGTFRLLIAHDRLMPRHNDGHRVYLSSHYGQAGHWQFLKAHLRTHRKCQ